MLYSIAFHLICQSLYSCEQKEKGVPVFVSDSVMLLRALSTPGK